MPGPPPKHPSTRARARNAKQGFRVLEGGKLPVPNWPLPPDLATSATLDNSRDRVARLQVEMHETEDARKRGRLSRQLDQLELQVTQLAMLLESQADAEAELWASLWAMPQAELWAESHAEREVAQYVRWTIKAEGGDLKAAVEARQRSDRLGLNPLALLRLRAEIAHVGDVEEKRATKKRPATSAKKPTGDDPRSGLFATG